VGAKGVLVVKGTNGCGKTTLLSAIAGLLAPSEGIIKFSGYDIAENLSAYHGLLHYVGHKNALKPYLTVEQNIRFWANMRETKELVAAALACFGLELYKDVPVGKMSAGWQRKVALSRLICCHSTLWIMDEPFANLDEAARQRLREVIEVRADQGGIIVLSSHDHVGIQQAVEIDLGDYVA
jgi:heme exporter protein A